MMKLGELMSLMSCKNGDELFLRVTEILDHYGISVINEDMSVKDLHMLCFDVADVLNQEK
jgi:hypothetical protein